MNLAFDFFMKHPSFHSSECTAVLFKKYSPLERNWALVFEINGDKKIVAW